jgi:hypothetical protein
MPPGRTDQPHDEWETAMNSKTLAAAFSTALIQHAPRPKAARATTADEVLISALRNSATDRDLIVLRRIGMPQVDPPEKV